MSARSGLQRRRPPGWERHESTPYASEDEEPSRPGSSGLRGHAHVVEKSSGTGSIAAIDMQSGHRYAYDPRDVSDEHETMAHPTLTLMEEVLLLGLKDRQGYLSFWNDSISYTLRGCILMELALRGRISVMRHPDNKLCHPANRLVEVRDTKHTGDPILDETLRILKSNPPAGITEWLDLLSGESWNVLRLNLQLKQIRERIAKGLVDKGVLRTEKRNFLLFDMPTHPLADPAKKDAILRRLYALITSKSQSVHPEQFYKEETNSVALRVTRTLCMVCGAYSGNVLENTLTHLPVQTHELAFQRVTALLVTFGQWPMAPGTPGGGIPGRSAAAPTPSFASTGSSKTQRPKIGAGDAELSQAMLHEMRTCSTEASFEVLAGVLSAFAQMDSLL